MMNIVKPFHLSFNKQVLEHNNQFHFIASITMGIRLSTGESLLETKFLQQAIENMGAKPLPDVGMPKPCAEYLISGSYFSPQNVPVPAGEVKVKVGLQDKKLYVFGPRQWEMGVPSKPGLITSVPIEYNLAYGGNMLETNMDGVGYQGDDLPSIENPDQLITSPTMKAKPAGFSVLDPACAQRRRFLGTYDDNYLQQFFPGYPADFDWNFFLAAPDDQRIEGYYQGDEYFEFHNMHPQQAFISGRLPGYICRSFLRHGRQDEHLQFTELKLNLDTLWFFPHADLALVIWRGGMQVRDDEAEQITDVLLAFESPEDPVRDLDYYETALKKRLNSDDVLLNNFNTQDLIPVGVKCAMQIFQEDALSDDEKGAFVANMDAKVEAIQAQVKEKTDELIKQSQAGMESATGAPENSMPDLEKLLKNPQQVEKDADVEALKAKMESILPGITSGDPKKLDLTKFSFDKISEIMALVQALTDKKTEMALQQTEKAAEQLKQEIENGMQADSDGAPAGSQESRDVQDMLAGMNQKSVPQEGPLPRVDAKSMAAKLNELKPDLTLAMQNLQAMKAAGIDDENTRNMEIMINQTLNGQNEEIEKGLKLAETAFRETYIMGAHHMQAGTSPHKDSVEQVAEKFIQLISGKQSVAGGDWACIDLSGRVLDNIDLSNCLLEQVDFTGSSLRNVNLSGAILARANLSGADLTGANLEDANIGGIIAHGANFTDARMRSAKLSKADFTRANFTRCHIEEVESLELQLNYADFSEAHLVGLKFIEADIKGASFFKADLSGTMFLQCNLQNVDFQQAVMPRCVWADTMLDQVNFDAADLSRNCFVATEPDKSKMTGVTFVNACLDNINLQGMSMAGSDFSKASMDNAIFSGADCHQSNFSLAHAPQAQFRKANLQHSNLSGINLMEGSLAKARLSGASFSRANLYSVDFLRSTLGETDFTGCNLDNTLLKDWRP